VVLNFGSDWRLRAQPPRSTVSAPAAIGAAHVARRRLMDGLR